MMKYCVVWSLQWQIDSRKDNMSNISRKELQEKRIEANRIKSDFSKRLQRKELTFEQFIQFAQQEQYKYLRTFKVSQLLGKMPGWSDILAKRALITLGLNPDVTIKKVISNPRQQQQISNLMSATSNNWQDRRAAPSGFPWYGNILDTFSEIYKDGYKLPPEIERTVRYYLDDDVSQVEDNNDPESLTNLFAEEDIQEENLESLLNGDSSDQNDIIEDDDIDEEDDDMIDLEDLLGE